MNFTTCLIDAVNNSWCPTTVNVNATPTDWGHCGSDCDAIGNNLNYLCIIIQLNSIPELPLTPLCTAQSQLGKNINEDYDIINNNKHKQTATDYGTRWIKQSGNFR